MTIRRVIDIVLLCHIDSLAVWWLERRTNQFTVEIKPLIEVLRQTAWPDDPTSSELMLDAYRRNVLRRVE
jgi:hypothetical protein